jgi:1-aminocyclopropane-1-carboxylate deaminase
VSKSLSELSQKLQALISSSPLQEVNHPLLKQKKVTLSVKRDDLLHPDISGNKWRKLKFNLIEARTQEISHLVSFGGAYSNHIHALAAAGYHFGFKTSAIIRGEPHYASNPTLKQAQQWGMQLHFVSRKEYKYRENAQYLQALQTYFPDALLIPEGGSSHFALPGVIELCDELKLQSTKRIDHIFTATGSGGTLAGLIAGFSNNHNNYSTTVTGIAVLKQADYLIASINNLLQESKQADRTDWHLMTQFHGGGYAKVSSELREFCLLFEQQTRIPIEPIYTGKMFYALFELLRQDHFKAGDHIIALHTGGLQGLKGLAIG